MHILKNIQLKKVEKEQKEHRDEWETIPTLKGLGLWLIAAQQYMLFG